MKISHIFNDGQQHSPSATVLDDGTLAVAYVDRDDNNDRDVHVAHLRPDGTIFTKPIAISDADQTDAPANTALPGGGYVVAFALDDQVIGQIRDAQGNLIGFPLDVITITGDAQETALATLTSGQFVAVSEFEKPDSDNVYFDIPGLDIGGQISAATDVDESDPDVAALKGGGFVVVWEEEGADSSGQAIMATIRSNTGTVTKLKFQVNTTEAGNQDNPSVTALADGGFLVVWNDDGAGRIRA